MSSYSKPDVIVKRVITPTAIVLGETAQRQCIIGTSAQIENDISAGVYVGGSELFPYPQIEDDSIVDASSLSVALVKDGLSFPMELGVDYTVEANNAGVLMAASIEEYNEILGSTSSTGVISNGVLTDPNAAFVGYGVGAGDKVYSAQLGTGEVDVMNVTSNTELKIVRPVVFEGLVSTTDTSADIVMDSATVGDFDALAIGDELMISGVGYIVASITDASNLTLATAMTATASGLASAGYSNAEDTISISYSILKKIIMGNGGGSTVLMSYVAPRNISEVTLVDDLAIFADKYGNDITPDNPISLAASIAYKNGGAEFYSVVIPDDSMSSHIDAIAAIDSLDVTYITPLTMDKSYIELYEAHVVDASKPENKRERILLAATDISFRNVKVAANACVITSLGSDQYNINISGSDMVGSGVINGDLVYLESVKIGDDQPLVGYSVVSVASATAVVVESITDITGHVSDVTVASPEYTRRQQAEYVKNVSIGILKENVIRTWPPKVEVDSGDDITVEAGFYLAVAEGAKASANFAHKPLTNSTLIGFGDLLYSNGYFTEADLDEMASGGVTIMIQDGIGSAPKIRHQLTTDMSNVKTREFSFIKNLYYLTKVYREAMSGYTGKYNITKSLYNMMTLTASSVFDEWTGQHGDLGSRVIDVELVSIERDPIEEDKVISEIRATLPLPNNKTEITFYA